LRTLRVSYMMVAMKRIVPTVALALCALASSFALPSPTGITVGAELRYAQTQDDMTHEREAEWDVELEYYPVTAEIGVQWDDPLPAAPFETAYIAGFRAGMAGIVDTEAPDRSVHYRLTTVPFGAFTRLEAGFLYLDLGVGAHRWSLDYEVNGVNLDNSGFGLATSVSAGFRAALFRHLTLRTAGIVTYYGIGDIGTGVSANSLAAGLVCAVNYH